MKYFSLSLSSVREWSFDKFFFFTFEFDLLKINGPVD
jgi:hypothetical protein